MVHCHTKQQNEMILLVLSCNRPYRKRCMVTCTFNHNSLRVVNIVEKFLKDQVSVLKERFLKDQVFVLKERFLKDQVFVGRKLLYTLSIC